MAPSDAPEALFLPDGARHVPTDAARGPWNPDWLHGAAVAGLLAGALEDPDRVLARLTVDLLAPVPMEPLTVRTGPPAGGRRVRRQSAEVLAGARPVARGHSVTVRRTALDLPEGALDHGSPFDPAAAPPLEHPHPGARRRVGWASFDTCAVAMHFRGPTTGPSAGAGSGSGS